MNKNIKHLAPAKVRRKVTPREFFTVKSVDHEESLVIIDVRNPERIQPFLEVLKEMEGEEFNEDGQIKYQVLLIQNRLYEPFNLPAELQRLYETLEDKMSYSDALSIFEFMKRESSILADDPGVRGRTSVAPLTKMGLAVAKKTSGPTVITDFGNALLEKKIDLGEAFFRFLLKWQLPNPESSGYKKEDGYDIKPFVGVLHLVQEVNRLMIAENKKPKGVSREEFNIFGPTLINHEDIEEYAKKILEMRRERKNLNDRSQKQYINEYRNRWAAGFIQSNDPQKIAKFVADLKDYGDSAIRYFRLTQYVIIRGSGYYIDLEPRRAIELGALLSGDDSEALDTFDASTYFAYLSDSAQPILPWETGPQLMSIAKEVFDDLARYEVKLSLSPKYDSQFDEMKDSDLKTLIAEMRAYRRELQEEVNRVASQSTESIKEYVSALHNIRSQDNPPLALEKYTALALHALNDAIKIQPNYPVRDDNEPTFTAPAGVPDIECVYESFSSIAEVTMLTNRSQWYNEGQPVMRHLRDFEDVNSDKSAYCLFISPGLHRDTINTFWSSVKHEYEGSKQKIIPLTIDNFSLILATLIHCKELNKPFTSLHLVTLYDAIADSVGTCQNAGEWIEAIPGIINGWQKTVTA